MGAPAVREDSLPATIEQVPTGPFRIDAVRQQEPPILLSLIVPTYNEAKNVREMVRSLTELLDGPLGERYELVVVDDNSPDRTWEIAEALRAEFPRLRVLRRQTEKGLSTAVIRGWQIARGEILGVIDADLQHPPEVTLALLKEMERGADLAVASRHVEGGGVSDWSLLRRILSRGAQLLGLFFLPGVLGRVSDPMSGYFMVRRTSLEGVTMSPLGYKILLEVLGRGSIRWVAEAPYVFRERVEGESKVTWRLYIEYLRHLMRLRLASLPISRFVRFALVGLSGVVVDMGLLYVLSDPSTLGWGLTRSKLVAAQAAIVNNFLWNDAWTFRDMAHAQAGVGAKLRRFLKFELVCLTGLVLNTLLLNLQFNYLHIDRYVANATAIVIVTGWNFWLNMKLSWRASVAEQAAPGLKQ